MHCKQLTCDCHVEIKGVLLFIILLAYWYLAADCQLIADSGRPQLRSAHANVLTVPRTNT